MPRSGQLSQRVVAVVDPTPVPVFYPDQVPCCVVALPPLGQGFPAWPAQPLLAQPRQRVVAHLALQPAPLLPPHLPLCFPVQFIALHVDDGLPVPQAPQPVPRAVALGIQPPAVGQHGRDPVAQGVQLVFQDEHSFVGHAALAQLQVLGFFLQPAAGVVLPAQPDLVVFCADHPPLAVVAVAAAHHVRGMGASGGLPEQPALAVPFVVQLGLPFPRLDQLPGQVVGVVVRFAVKARLPHQVVLGVV